MSVTRPTLTAFLAGAAAVEVVSPADEELLSSSEPQPAATSRMPAAPKTAMARRVERARTCEYSLWI